MRAFKSASLAAILAAAVSSTALAADPAGYQPIMEAVPIVEEAEMGSNWYLRGDIAYSVWNDLKADANWIDGEDIRGHQVSSSRSYGFGVGYNFGWFRADLTFDYFDNANYSGRTAGNCGTGGACTSTESVSFDATTGLINAYFDLGTWGGLTPYIGAGVGLAQVRFGQWTTVETCAVTGLPNACPGYHGVPAGVSSTTSYMNPGERDIKVAYAAMAGFSYALTHNLSLDVGYRYVGFESGRAVDPYRNGAGVEAGAVDFDNMNTQEVRVGMRYVID